MVHVVRTVGEGSAPLLCTGGKCVSYEQLGHGEVVGKGLLEESTVEVPSSCRATDKYAPLRLLLCLSMSVSCVTLLLCGGLGIALYQQHCFLRDLSEKFELNQKEYPLRQPYQHSQETTDGHTDTPRQEEPRGGVEGPVNHGEEEDTTWEGSSEGLLNPGEGGPEDDILGTNGVWAINAGGDPLEKVEDHWTRRKRRAGIQGGTGSQTSRRARHHRRKRCVHCPANVTRVDHLHGYPNTLHKTGDFGGAPKKNDTYRHWKVAEWSTGVKNVYSTVTGQMAIKMPGIYWVYAQVTFLNAQQENGFGINLTRHVNDTAIPPPETIARCLQTTSYNNPKPKVAEDNFAYRTCHTGLPIALKTHDKVYITSLYPGRLVIFDQASSFWGLVRLSPNPME